jgi:hypothetical protein
MATTGIASSGTDFIGATGALKEVYDKPFENNIEGESEVWSALEKTDGFEMTDEAGDGKGIKINHTFSYGGGVYAMSESDYFGSSSLPTTTQSDDHDPHDLGHRPDVRTADAPHGERQGRVRELGRRAPAEESQARCVPPGSHVARHRDRYHRSHLRRA